MNRDYDTGTNEEVTFFVGNEIEHTPAYGMRTLFINGIQEPLEIAEYAVQETCKHLFFGANHSFHPMQPSEWHDWEELIECFLKDGYLCSLDIPIDLAETFLEGPLVEYDNFIPQIRVPIPYIKQWNYNTMLKIDDRDFKASNPGVWSHSLHDLMDREKFTSWDKYSLDKILK